MRVGPSESFCRERLQTTFRCCGQKPWSCCVEKTRKRRAVRKMKEATLRSRLVGGDFASPKLAGGERLEPLMDPRFPLNSFGDRPGKWALDAVGWARQRSWSFDGVCDLDIKGFG